MSSKSTKNLYTLPEACELLSISTATGRNWIKSGDLVPSAYEGRKPFFEKAALLTLKAALTDGTASRLNKRRNKTYVTGTQTYNSYIKKTSDNRTALTYLLDTLHHLTVLNTVNDGRLPATAEPLSSTLLLCLLRHCAEQLIIHAGYPNTLLFQELLDELVSEIEFVSFQETHEPLCRISYTYYPEEDTLGFLYLSLSNLSGRKASGSYYTPCWLANRLIENHLPALDSTKTLLDPSCGTGIFLLQLPTFLPLQNIYGSDFNPTSIALTRINLALKYHISTQEELDILKHNITVTDFLTKRNNASAPQDNNFDVILGNPPWGANLSAEAKINYQKHFSCATGSTIETYDLFIEKSLCHLTPDGILAFVLPEALLNVKSHLPVRKLLLEQTSVLSVEYLGEVFEGVHCPSMILAVAKTKKRPFFQDVSVTLENGSHFSAKTERRFLADYFAFSLTDKEYLLLQKILSCPDHAALLEHAVFALGIVTGNNVELLHNTPAPGTEPVIKGCDISRYHINSHSGYLAFTPEKFQQTAPEKYYRTPEKLFYRFINKQLIFAYDNTGMLSLNSCNILIPQINGLSTKYVMAVLNSSAAQFVFAKMFRSVKVLRSHLEQIPIPLADPETQEEITALVDILLSHEESSAEYQTAFSLVDKRIADLFHLTTEEYKTICT